MKVGFKTFQQFHGKQHIGSSRIRAEWVAKYWDEAEIFKMGAKYDVVIYQKVYWIEHAKLFKGVKILDICDPDWFHWGMRVKEMIDLCDAVTTSTLELAKAVVKFTDKPVWYIPDRLDLELFKGQKKVHKGEAKIAAWYGYSENFPMLDGAVPSLVKNKFEELIVIASRRSPYKLPPALEAREKVRKLPDGTKEVYMDAAKIAVSNLPWSEATVNGDLLKADIVINPRGTKGRWKFKSNNKTIMSWALGLPVAHSEEEMTLLIPEAARKVEAEIRLKEVKEKYDVKISVQEFKNLIAEIERSRNEHSTS